MISAIILMAGKGARMKLNINKVLLPLGDKLVFEYSLNTISKYVDEIICVISKTDEDVILPRLPKNVKIAYGGETRGESVASGLRISTGDYVIIHDAARPFVSDEVMSNIINNVNFNECILTYLEVADTIKMISNNSVKTIDRSKLIKACTPQCAPYKLLASAYDKAIKENITATDDISLIEKFYPNVEIKLIKANDECFKITSNTDYKLAQLIGGNND